MKSRPSTTILLLAFLVLTACASPEVALVSTATPFLYLPTPGATLLPVATPPLPKSTLAPAGTYPSVFPPGGFAGPITQCLDQKIGGQAKNEIQQGMRLPTAAEESVIQSCLLLGTPSPQPTGAPHLPALPRPTEVFAPLPWDSQLTDAQRRCLEQLLGAQAIQDIQQRKRLASPEEVASINDCLPRPTAAPVAVGLTTEQRACIDRIISAQARSEIEKAGRPRTPLEDKAFSICQNPTTAGFVPPQGATSGVFSLGPVGFDSARAGCIKNTLGIQAAVEIALGYRQMTAVEDSALAFCNSYANADFVPSPGLTFGKYEPVLPRYASGGDCIVKKISAQAYGEFFLGYRLPAPAEEGIVQYCKGLRIDISALVSPKFDPARRQCIESRIGAKATQDIGNWIRDPTPDERYIVAMCQCGGVFVTNYFGEEVLVTLNDQRRGVAKNGGVLCFRIDNPGRYRFSYNAPGIRPDCGRYNDCTVEFVPGRFTPLDLW